MSVTDMQSRRGKKDAPEAEAGTGVVESDLAEDTGPDYAGMSDDERQTAYDELMATGQVTEQAARAAVWGETEEPKPTPPMQIPLPGDWNTLNDVAGGAQPTSSEARLLGGAMPIEGQFKGEEIITLIVEAKVSEVHMVYTTDDWGQTKAVKRRHRMRMLSVRKA